MNKKFELEYQYKLFLKRMGLSEENMPPVQKKVMKQIFMGTCGQLILLLRDDIGALEEEEAIKVMKSMLEQVGNFFLKETNKQN